MTPIRRVWITRASPGAERTADRLTVLGFQPVVAPLLAIEPIPQPAPDLDGVRTLVFTSRNGVAAFAALSDRRDRPVLTVGDATADAARQAGFQDVTSASGALDDLAALIRRTPNAGPVLACLAETPAGDLAARVGGGVEIRTLPVYRAVATPAAPPQAFDAVLIHSPRAALELARRLAPDAARSRLAITISPAAAAPLAAMPFAAVRVAAHPHESALISALGNPGARV
ncbi:uroporphyrinogen-III synthase [Brevundimonas sp. S30B]|nr:uroporphyrinogen-III synthase [Brevundimonas sp. MF30-B]TFW00760.1 uroporphyrinogen-III synthase [Brevundimonas sp. S30B]